MVLESYSHMTDVTLHLPFNIDENNMVMGDTHSLYYIYFYIPLYFDLPPRFTFISLLLNLAWLGLLYLFISRVLLREPRRAVDSTRGD